MMDPLRRVQRRLGHAWYETTFIYLTALENADDLDDEALAIFDENMGAEQSYDDF